MKKLITLIAGLLTSGIILYGAINLYKKTDYSKQVLRETGKMFFDSIMDNSPKINDDEIYMDLHAHLKKPDYYKGGIEGIVDTAMKRVDVLAVTIHDIGLHGELDYKSFKNLIKENSKYKVEDYGSYINIKTKDDNLIAIKAQELMCKNGQDMLAIGHENIIRPYQTIEKTIKDIHNKKGIAIIAHPMTFNRTGSIPFGLATKEERKKLEEVCEKADALEEFNSQNYLWLCYSNVLAKAFIKKHNLSGTASSDLKYEPNQIGLSGIIAKKDSIDVDNFVEDLRSVIKNKKFKTHKEYTNPISFLRLVIDLTKD